MSVNDDGVELVKTFKSIAKSLNQFNESVKNVNNNWFSEKISKMLNKHYDIIESHREKERIDNNEPQVGIVSKRLKAIKNRQKSFGAEAEENYKEFKENLAKQPGSVVRNNNYVPVDTSVLKPKSNVIIGFGKHYIDNEMLIDVFGDLGLDPEFAQENGMRLSLRKMTHGRITGPRGWNLTREARDNKEKFKYLRMLAFPDGSPEDYVNLLMKPYSGEVPELGVNVKEMVGKTGQANTPVTGKVGAYGDHDYVAMAESLAPYVSGVVSAFKSFGVQDVDPVGLLGRALSVVMDYGYEKGALKNMKDLIYKGVSSSLDDEEKLMLKTYLVGSMLDIAGFDEQSLEELITIPTVKVNIDGVEKDVRVLSEMSLSKARGYIENYDLESQLNDRAGVAAYWLNNDAEYNNLTVAAVHNIAAVTSDPKDKFSLKNIYEKADELVGKITTEY